MDNYDINFILLDISASDTTVYIEGNVTIQAAVQNNPLDTFVTGLSDDYTVDSVFFNDVIHSYTHTDNEILVPLSPAQDIGNTIEVQIYYHGQSSGTGFFTGISNEVDEDWDVPVTWTLSEPFSAIDWFPCKQVLEDKIDSVYIFITVDSTCKAGSNGLLTAVTSMPEGKHRYEWKSFYPIAYYLISMSVAKYSEYNIYAHPQGISDSILIQNYLYDDPAFMTQYKEGIDRTADFIELFSDLYGMYPFKDEKYGHCFTPLGGGMEHQTMTTLGGFSFVLVSHELGHQWFGDLVTCATWQDIWINEGFASYTEYLAWQNLDSQEMADQWMSWSHNFIMEQPGGSIFIPEEDAENVGRIFDNRLSYKKGAAIIHMIRYIFQNDPLFFQTLQTFLEQFKDSVATGEDFKGVVESVSGLDFTDYFNQWYYGEGYPVYDILWHHANDTLTLNITQSTSTVVTTFFNIPMEYKLYHHDGDTTIRIEQTENVQSFQAYLPYPLDSIQVDPDNWVLNGVGVIQSVTDPTDDLNSYFACYPNPFNDQIFVQLPDIETNMQIRISDITGKIIYDFFKNSNNSVINTSLLPEGIYFIKINTENNIYIKKLIKK